MSKYTEADMAFLQDLKDTSAFELARMAGAHVHSGIEGPAAEILGEVRDAVVQRWEAGRFDWDSANNDGDLISECAAEGIITDHEHERMLLFVDLGAYGDDNEHSHGEWSGTFHDMAAQAIEQITWRAASAFVDWARTCFTREFECADCGDSGAPHICYPGDCRGTDEDREAWAMHKEAERLSASPHQPTHPLLAPMPVGPPSEADRALWDASLTEAHKDPLYRMLVDAPESVTQGFMRRLAQANRDEFAARKLRRQRLKLAAGILAVLTSGGIVMVLAWSILKGF